MKTMLVNHPNAPVLPVYANLSMRWHLAKNMQKVFLKLPWTSMKVERKILHLRINANSKKSAFQEFQDFAKPLRLLPASKPNTYTRYNSEGILSSLEVDESDALYLVELHTSKDFGSCLRPPNAAILLCFIDIQGDSILQRISAASYVDPGQGKINSSDSIDFQRGSVDIVTFKGPKLGKLEALWIGVESGSWRIDGLHLAVISGPLSLPRSTGDVKEERIDGMQYKFEVNNIPLGEGGVSVTELRPVIATEFSSDNISTLSSLNFSPTSALDTSTYSNEESMREYKDLKLSLLIYDALLTIVGFIVTSFTISSKAGYAFLFGGMSGLLYLLLLQRSVDGLPIIESPADAKFDNFGQTSRGFKGPLFFLAVVLVMSITAVKYGIGGVSVALTPSELLIGAAGFLTCKIAVVLAASRPFRVTKKE